MTQYRFAKFEVDPQAGEIRADGRPIKLQNQPFQILLLLVEHAGTVVTRDQLRTRIWPTGTHLNFDQSLNRSINKLRDALEDSEGTARFIETLAGRGYRFSAPVELCKSSFHRPSHDGRLENVRAALPIDSPFYVVRHTDALLHRAIDSCESVVLLTGARQTGKTSLLSRCIDDARDAGKLVLTTDLSRFSSTQLSSVTDFFFTLADELAHQYSSGCSPESVWNDRRSPNINFDRFLKSLIAGQPSRLVWAIDEADQLFSTDYGNGFFALVRSWHNERAIQPESPIQQLTVVLSYAREAHVCISDENQSPFNVGTKIYLTDFDRKEVEELNETYRSVLTPEQVTQLHRLTAGHPLLTNGSMQIVSLREMTFDLLMATAALSNGPFGDHLNCMAKSLRRNPALAEAVRSILKKGNARPEHIHDLRGCGILAQNDVPQTQIRCSIYEQFLTRELG